MWIEGEVSKDPAGSRWWAVEVPDLRLHTQGKSKKDGYAMAKNAIELMAEVEGYPVTVTIKPGKGGKFHIGSDDVKGLIAFLLRRQREMSRMTLKEVATRLNAKSVNAYARYEQGRSEPTISKLAELLTVINPTAIPIITFG